MSEQLESLKSKYDRADQETKRRIGEYIHNRPARWVTKRQIVEEFEIDESGVSRHLEDFYDDEFVMSKLKDGERVVQWEGKGSGGFEYWIRQLIPPQLWAASNELRPLFTLNFLGGAYAPTIIFFLLFFLGTFMGLFSIIIAFYPSKTVLGFTTTSGVILTGLVTIFASLLLVTIPLAKMLEVALWRAWHWGTSSPNEED